MRRFTILRLMSAVFLLHIVLTGQPALCQDVSESDSLILTDFHFLPSDIAEDQKHSAAGEFLRDIWKDQKAIWTSPLYMNRRQLLTIALPLAGATAGLMATDKETTNFLSNSPDQVKWSKRFSQFGAIYTLGVVTGGPLVGGKVIDKPHFSQIGRNALEALVNAILVNYAIKGFTGREQPDEGNGEGRFWEGGQSFPSGHSMNIWAVAIAIARDEGLSPLSYCSSWKKVRRRAFQRALKPKNQGIFSI